MSQNLLTIWTNAQLSENAARLLAERIAPHRLEYAAEMSASNLAAGQGDSALAEADIALGQPDVAQVMASAKLRWVHLTSAGYTAYDRDDLREALRGRGARLTNSSGVYNEPCAEHVLAMMMALARQIPQSLQTQLNDRGWPIARRRIESRLLVGQTALIFGFGAIAQRLCELLAPFRMNLLGVRRNVTGDEPIKMISEEWLDEYLPEAGHVLNILPANASTAGYFNAAKFNLMKPGAIFYNIGRGTTVDQAALLDCLQSGKLAAAYLDVTDPEPLPPEHPLWTAPNCFITPHTAGGFDLEFETLVEHFLENLRRFTAGESLLNRVV
jgi:phosphoglycerate dehydrogenase-like enzyme